MCGSKLPNINRKIIGIDFSGAREASKHIWITIGYLQYNKQARIEEIHPLYQLMNTPVNKVESYQALREFIASNQNAIIGLDFPFGLPDNLNPEENWEALVRNFGEHFSSPEAFRAYCQSRQKNRELKRHTDKEARAPFSPYNLRLYRQTFYGIGDVLSPLIQTGKICVLPLQPAHPGKPWVVEICPACFLKRHGWYFPYKGKAINRKKQRKILIEILTEKFSLKFKNNQMKNTLVENDPGDALDSLLAFLILAETLQDPTRLFPESLTTIHLKEGYICY